MSIPLFSGATRRECDAMGTLSVPRDACFGAQTWRAVQNFPLSGTPIGALRPRIPLIGYDAVAAIAESSLSSGKSVRDLAQEGGISDETLR